MAEKDNGTKSSNPEKNGLGWFATLLVCLVVLFLGGGITAYIFLTEPTAQRVGATKETAMLVEFTRAQKGSFTPTIVATGTVMPAREIELSPRVSGKVIALSESFTPGGFVKEGESLLRIDPADFENALTQRKSELGQAIAALEIEMGRQKVAQRDYNLLGENLADVNKDLVLRKPQLNNARAHVASARAAVRQAALELERTDIRAPFNAHILRRNVNVGSEVSPGNNLGHLVGQDTYWVEATVPLSKIRRISFPDTSGEDGSRVQIRNRSAWPENEYREGKVFKLVGALENRTRMGRVLVTVEDPLAYRRESEGLPALMIGSFVEARIQARKISDVFRLNRDYVRKNDTVWLFNDGLLEIRPVKIEFRDTEYVYIREGLDEKDRVVITNLSTVTDGARLRSKGGGGFSEENSSQAKGAEKVKDRDVKGAP